MATVRSCAAFVPSLCRLCAAFVPPSCRPCAAWGLAQGIHPRSPPPLSDCATGLAVAAPALAPAEKKSMQLPVSRPVSAGGEAGASARVSRVLCGGGGSANLPVELGLRVERLEQLARTLHV